MANVEKNERLLQVIRTFRNENALTRSVNTPVEFKYRGQILRIDIPGDHCKDTLYVIQYLKSITGEFLEFLFKESIEAKEMEVLSEY